MSDLSARPGTAPLDGARTAWLIGAAWTVIAFVVITWLWAGPGRLTFQSPDEASTAHGAGQVAERGRPALPIAFDDPTSLSHQRMWVAADGDYVPASPPGALLAYGAARAFPGGGWLQLLVPAAGVGALAAATSLLLGRRRWLAATVPGLAFPAVYWLLRPWHNVSLELALAAFGLLAGVLAARTRRPGWRFAMVGCAVAASAVRPDHLHVLLGLSLLWAVALEDGDRVWRRWLGWHAVAGVLVVLSVVVGNLLTTGEALTTPIDLQQFPEEFRPVGRGLGFPWSQLLLILAPNGWQPLGNVVSQATKYALALGPVAAVTLGGLAAVGAFARARDRFAPRTFLAVLGSAALLAVFAWSRISETDLGAAADRAGLVHSYPRYVAVVYVALAVAVVVAISRIDREAWARAAGVGAVVVALLGVVYLFLPGPEGEGFAWLRGHLRNADAYVAAIDAQAPDDAFLYSRNVDKFVWGIRPTGMFQAERVPPGAPPVDAPGLAASMAAAFGAGFDPYAIMLLGDEPAAVRRELVAYGLGLETAGWVLPPVEGVPDVPVLRVVALP